MACPVFAASLPAWLIRISLVAALASYCVICAVTRQKPPWVDYSNAQSEHAILSGEQQVSLVFGYFVIGLNTGLIAAGGVDNIMGKYAPYFTFMYVLQIVSVVLTETAHYRKLRNAVDDACKQRNTCS